MSMARMVVVEIGCRRIVVYCINFGQVGFSFLPLWPGGNVPKRFHRKVEPEKGLRMVSSKDFYLLPISFLPD